MSAPPGDDPASNGAQPGPTARAPRRWKSILVTFLVVFPTIELLTRVVAPLLGPIPALLRDVLVVATMCVMLSFVLPVINQRVRDWLVR
jgi:antibiotic biosynthesis monooxygenase (ABM) superfamily enzyme